LENIFPCYSDSCGKMLLSGENDVVKNISNRLSLILNNIERTAGKFG